MKQKGQALVEFAFVVPMLIFLFISIMYIGITFIEWIQYSNAARDAARDIATQYNESGVKYAKSAHELRKSIISEINNANSARLKRYALEYINPLYAATWHAEMQDKDGNPSNNESEVVDVCVKISLKRRDLPPALESLNILPVELKQIVHKMRIETPTVVESK